MFKLSSFCLLTLTLPTLSQTINALSETEKSAGWELMFDGKALTGWHSYQQDTITKVVGKPGWGVDDSAIYRIANGAGGLLAPVNFIYKNFEIAIDWKIPEKGNSGIFLRYLESEVKEFVRTGPETQICGKGHDNYGDGMAKTSPGACYDMYPPAREWIRSADQYNTLHVIMFEKRVAHFGNGIKLLEYEIGTGDWNTRYAASKYSSFPLYGDIHAGKLLLQDHGFPVWFRNVKIRALKTDPWAAKDFVWPDQAANSILRRPYGRDGAHGIGMRMGNGISLVIPEETHRVIQVLDMRGISLENSDGYGAWRTQMGPGLFIVKGMVGQKPFVQKVVEP